MEAKVHVPIVLLLLTIMSTFVSGAHPIGLGVKLFLYYENDYNDSLRKNIRIIDTERNTSESNYPNTVLFYHYTKERRYDSVQLYIGNEESLRVGQFDPKKPTVFVIHGWLNNHLSAACTYVRDAYLEQHDYNIIVVDWGELAEDGIYPVASRVKSVAKYVSKMLNYLVSRGLDPSNTTIVGHSFGAHLAGLASYYAENKVNYIFGLDPAAPAFDDKGKGSRLTKDNANYVQAIHASFYYGSSLLFGHADFFVNGGKIQPGCVIPQICDHDRSVMYFAESVNSKGFVARKCENYANYKLGLCNSNESAYMGGATPDPNAQGVFYVDTNSEPPFAKN